MDGKLIVSSSPHIRSNVSTKSIMRDVIIALIPALVAGTVIFGFRVLLVTAVCVGTAVIAEYITRKILKREDTIGDLSAVVTGMLLAFNLPVSINLFIAALGSIIAIVFVKQCFGGIGQNFVNPALAARIILLVSFPTHMTDWVAPMQWMDKAVDGVTSATPLVAMAYGDVLPPVTDMLFGLRRGCLGETCAIALIIGFIYLVWSKVISPIIPVTFVGTVAVFTLILGKNPIYHVLSGGLLLGAIFMATDYTTSPLTKWGKVIYGVGCGFLTVVIRIFGNLPEGVSFAIVIMNIITPLIERITKSRPFGVVREVKAKGGAN